MATIASAHVFGVAAQQGSWRAWLPGIGLFTFCAILFFLGLGERDLTSSHEARAAQNAQTILDEGHWLVPRLFDRHLELQKPPLYYWLVALIGWLQGGMVDAWAVRLPAAIAALGCVLFLFFLGHRVGRPYAGLLAGLILTTSLHFTWLAHVGRIDMPLTFAITVALGAFHLGQREPMLQLRWHALGYASLGVGLLLKGPIAAVLPAIVVGTVWLRGLWNRQERAVSKFRTLWWGVPFMLAIAAPWYVWANIQTDNQLWEVFFWYHNVERGLGGSEALKAYPWWFYLPRSAIDLLPWSLVIPVAVFRFVRRGDDDAARGLLWFGSIAVFLSCMSFKRADYLLPAYPGMAIVLGVTLERWWSESGSKRRHVTVLASLLLTYVLGWQVYHLGFAQADDARPYEVMAERIRAETKGPVIFFRAESHVLMHHLGQPVHTILEWENLEWWTRRPRVVYFVMPEACAAELAERLPSATLHEVLRTRDFADGRRDRAMVVLRTQQ
jgi:4-amino-4-deoxy-L-arabinose transferase-like glycosyltransferase